MNRTLLLLTVWLTACGPQLGPTDPDTATTGITSTSTQGQDPACPPTWLEARQRCSQQLPCTGALRCEYPRMGDQLSDGTWATAVMGCFQPSGEDPGTITCAQ